MPTTRSPLAALTALVALALPGCRTAREARVADAPTDFLGTWVGTLHSPGRADGRTVTMRLVVTPIAGAADRLRWQLGYGDDDVRDYVLRIDDAATGRCTIDERNGIELAARFAAGELVSVFAVGGQLLDVRYRRVADAVEFALEAFDRDGGEATGQGVSTFPTVSRQRATLRRQ